MDPRDSGKESNLFAFKVKNILKDFYFCYKRIVVIYLPR